jgi:chorismate-pyruvate lyase
MLIFGDGSPTRLLTVLTGSRVAVQNVTHKDISSRLMRSPGTEIPEKYADGIPRRAILALLDGYEMNRESASGRVEIEEEGVSGSDNDGGDAVSDNQNRSIPVIIRRSVTLCNERSDVLGVGVSWWREEDLDATLPGDEKGKPIGGALMSNRLGVHRELIAVVRGRNKELGELLGGRGGDSDRRRDDATRSTSSTSSSAAALMASSFSLSTSAIDGLKEKDEEVVRSIGNKEEEEEEKEEEEDDDDLWGRFYVMWKEGRRLTVVYEVFSQRALQKWM